jgi:predicted TIM-barrel fold metal-dependent hydrolase
MLKKILVAAAVLFVFYAALGLWLIFDFARRPYPSSPPIHEYEPVCMLRVQRHFVASPRFPVIDAHSHPQESGLPIEELVRIMDEAGVRCIVDLNGGWGEGLKRIIERYELRFPGRFIVFANLNMRRVNEPGFGQEQAEELERSVALGARGLKLWKSLGMELRNPDGSLIPVDDDRFQPIWQKAAELGIPVLMHTADPTAFWLPLSPENERFEEIYLAGRLGWRYFLDPRQGMPSKGELLRQRESLLQKNPHTIFIGAHMAMVSDDLGYLATLLDRYPNFYVDMSDVVYDLGRQPYTTREFFIKYQDRILFGIDLYPEAEVYRDYYRFLETFDEYMEYPRYKMRHGRWKIYGIGLPDDVLRKIYNENARRLLRLTDFPMN